MKKAFRCFFSGFSLLLISTIAIAADNKLVIHLNDPARLAELVNVVTNTTEAFNKNVDIVVVVNGPAITRLASFSNNQESIQAILNTGAELGACSNAMQNKKLDASQLIKGVTVIKEGGVVRIMQLQKAGYSYIKI